MGTEGEQFRSLQQERKILSYEGLTITATLVIIENE